MRFKYIVNHSAKEYDLIEEKYYDRFERFEKQLKDKNINYEIIETFERNSIEEEMKEKQEIAKMNALDKYRV